MSATEQCIVRRISTLQDGTVRLTLDLQEGANLNSIQELLLKFCNVYICNAEKGDIHEEIKEQLDTVKYDDEKRSPSQQLRDVIWVLFETLRNTEDSELAYGELLNDFDTFYKQEIAKRKNEILLMIDKLK